MKGENLKFVVTALFFFFFFSILYRNALSAALSLEKELQASTSLPHLERAVIAGKLVVKYGECIRIINAEKAAQAKVFFFLLFFY